MHEHVAPGVDDDGPVLGTCKPALGRHRDGGRQSTLIESAHHPRQSRRHDSRPQRTSPTLPQPSTSSTLAAFWSGREAPLAGRSARGWHCARSYRMGRAAVVSGSARPTSSWPRSRAVESRPERSSRRRQRGHLYGVRSVLWGGRRRQALLRRRAEVGKVLTAEADRATSTRPELATVSLSFGDCDRRPSQRAGR